MGAIINSRDNTRQDVVNFGSFQISKLAINDELRQKLKQIVTAKAYPLLLVGDEGAGKHTIAKCLAASFLCDSIEKDGSACGECTSCHMLASGGHPDLVVLDPGPGGRCKVDELRTEVVARLFESPGISHNKVYIISAEETDTLSEICQNALLKPLEEHPDFVRFIVFCKDCDRLLPTILSRVQTLRLGHRSAEYIRQILNEAGVDDSKARKFALECSDGLPGMVLTLARDGKYQQIYDESLDLFKAFPHEKRTYFLTHGLEFFKLNRESTDMILRLLQSFLRELSIELLTENNKQYLTERAIFSKQELLNWSMLSIDFEGLLGLLSETRQALSSNANYDHTISRLLLQMRSKISQS